MKIDVLSADVSQNQLGRALVLAEALSLDHDVRVLGTRFRDWIWPPAEGHPIEIQAVPGAKWPRYRQRVGELVERIDADVVVAVKPLLPSYGVALRARGRTGVPVVLDIDDDQRALDPLSRLLRRPEAVLRPDNPLTGAFMHRMIPRADARIVASRALQRRFGGHLVRHVKDTRRLRPLDQSAADAVRRDLGVGDARVVMFVGTPRPWKGVPEAAAAVARIPDAVLVVVGIDGSKTSRRIAALPNVRPMESVPMARIPELLAAADVVVVPQLASPVTASQVPSKIFDAMAMARPVVATEVSDIPEILGTTRGRVVPPGDVDALAAAIRELLDAPGLARRLGAAAREWVEREASLEAARAPLNRALEEARSAAG